MCVLASSLGQKVHIRKEDEGYKVTLYTWDKDDETVKSAAGVWSFVEKTLVLLENTANCYIEFMGEEKDVSFTGGPSFSAYTKEGEKVDITILFTYNLPFGGYSLDVFDEYRIKYPDNNEKEVIVVKGINSTSSVGDIFDLATIIEEDFFEYLFETDEAFEAGRERKSQVSEGTNTQAGPHRIDTFEVQPIPATELNSYKEV